MSISVKRTLAKAVLMSASNARSGSSGSGSRENTRRRAGVGGGERAKIQQVARKRRLDAWPDPTRRDARHAGCAGIADTEHERLRAQSVAVCQHGSLQQQRPDVLRQGGGQCQVEARQQRQQRCAVHCPQHHMNVCGIAIGRHAAIDAGLQRTCLHVTPYAKRRAEQQRG